MDHTTFGGWLRRQGLAPRTCAQYLRIVRRLEEQAREQRTTLDRLDLPDLDAVVALWPRTHSARAQLRGALAHYWRFVGRPDPPTGAIRVPSKARMVCRALDELGALRLSRAARAAGPPAGLAVLCGLYGALRREEIARLRWDQLDTEAGRLTVVGKAERTRTFPLHPVLLGALLDAPRRAPWVFPGAGRTGHANPATIWTYVRRVAEAAQMPPVKPHQLRHTALATALDRTKDLRAVQDFAGHARPETTAGYTRTTGRRLEAVVSAIDYEAAAAEAAG